MPDGVEALSIEEVGRLLSRLRQPDLLRLAALARTWSIGLPRRDAADLLNEALTRILSGDRPWPAAVPLHSFLSQVMRSVASQWRHEDLREPLADDTVGTREACAPEAAYEFGDLTDRMRDALRDDYHATGIFEHILAQTSRKDARSLLGIDETGYDTVRRRMIRTLQRQFSPGWNNDNAP
jgi:hypothetical protein